MGTVRGIVTSVKLLKEEPDLFVCKGLIGPHGTVTGHEDQALVNDVFQSRGKTDLYQFFNYFNYKRFDFPVG